MIRHAQHLHQFFKRRWPRAINGRASPATGSAQRRTGTPRGRFRLRIRKFATSHGSHSRALLPGCENPLLTASQRRWPLPMAPAKTSKAQRAYDQKDGQSSRYNVGRGPVHCVLDGLAVQSAVPTTAVSAVPTRRCTWPLASMSRTVWMHAPAGRGVLRNNGKAAVVCFSFAL